MNPSDLCIAWIKHCEGLSLAAYYDANGWAIGYGHHGPEVHEGLVWTPEQAESAVISDASAAGRAVFTLTAVPLTQGQYDALTDFVFNLGVGALHGSTLLSLLNQGQYDDVPAQIMRWDHEGQAVVPGLAARRKGEVILWNGGNPLESL